MRRGHDGGRREAGLDGAFTNGIDVHVRKVDARASQQLESYNLHTLKSDSAPGRVQDQTVRSPAEILYLQCPSEVVSYRRKSTCGKRMHETELELVGKRGSSKSSEMKTSPQPQRTN